MNCPEWNRDEHGDCLDHGPGRESTPHVCQMCERPLEGHWWICVNPMPYATPSGLPTENARLYAREFAAEQLRRAANANVVGGIAELEAHLIAKADELWP